MTPVCAMTSDRAGGVRGIGVGEEGEVERGDDPRVRLPAARSSQAPIIAAWQASADADHEDPPGAWGPAWAAACSA